MENKDKSYVCEECERTVEMGEWPFCPHGYGQGGFKVRGGTERTSWITHRKPKMSEERKKQLDKM